MHKVPIIISKRTISTVALDNNFLSMNEAWLALFSIKE